MKSEAGRLVVTDPARWAAIRLFAMDVDGTLTDGSIEYDAAGLETKRFHVRDGYGIVLLREAGIPVAWISGRKSEVTSIRASELRIPHLIQPESDKAAALRRLVESLVIPLSSVCYIGDDTNDLGILALAGISCAPADAHPEVLRIASHVTRASGGRGAVREICDLILAHAPKTQ
jgi:3-deoxy-D-manno-octulosonate 8-phosphate phosphatase (KDO 8-P phosphatase)